MILYVSYLRAGGTDLVDEINFEKIAEQLLASPFKGEFYPREVNVGKDRQFNRTMAIAHRTDFKTISLVWPDGDPLNIKNEVVPGTMTITWSHPTEVLIARPESVVWIEESGVYYPDFAWLVR